MLDGLEKTINTHARHTPNSNPHKINFVRYADDFVVIERTEYADYVDKNRESVTKRQHTYKRRQQIVEHPGVYPVFGGSTIKRHL